MGKLPGHLPTDEEAAGARVLVRGGGTRNGRFHRRKPALGVARCVGPSFLVRLLVGGGAVVVAADARGREVVWSFLVFLFCVDGGAVVTAPVIAVLIGIILLLVWCCVY